MLIFYYDFGYYKQLLKYRKSVLKFAIVLIVEKYPLYVCEQI